jgi:hypothetical protein
METAITKKIFPPVISSRIQQLSVPNTDSPLCHPCGEGFISIFSPTFCGDAVGAMSGGYDSSVSVKKKRADFIASS